MDANADPTWQVVEHAAALLIGNEILSGKVSEQNLTRLARTLRALGVRLQRVLLVEDDVAVIAREVRGLSEAFDVVFTSGGVGPTHDDVTLPAVAQAFDRPLVREPRLEQLLRRRYGSQCTESHLRMARVPSGACLTEGSQGWPAVVVNNVWVLPGLPPVFAENMAAVRTCLRGPGPFYARAVLLRLEEPELADRLGDLAERHPGVEVGSYPKWFDPEYKTRITFDARDPGSMLAAVNDFLSLVPEGAVVRVE
jgi:molybdenum cofactor synthesis domain-containing protein